MKNDKKNDKKVKNEKKENKKTGPEKKSIEIKENKDTLKKTAEFKKETIPKDNLHNQYDDNNIEIFKKILNDEEIKSNNNDIENILDNNEYEENYCKKIHKKDVLSDLLMKIQNFKHIKRFDFQSKNNFDTLQEELTRSLQKINNINKKNTKTNLVNKAQTINYRRNYIRKSKNAKLKDLISLVKGKSLKKWNSFLIKSGLCNSNTNYIEEINTCIPEKNKYLIKLYQNKNHHTNSLKKNVTLNNNNNYYISCIDGKMIINGARKVNPLLLRYNYLNKKMPMNNNINDKNFDLFCSDFYKIKSRRNQSLNLNYLGKSTYKEFSLDDCGKTQKNNFNFCNNRTSKFTLLKYNYSKDTLIDKLIKINDISKNQFKFV